MHVSSSCLRFMVIFSSLTEPTSMTGVTVHNPYWLILVANLLLCVRCDCTGVRSLTVELSASWSCTNSHAIWTFESYIQCSHLFPRTYAIPTKSPTVVINILLCTGTYIYGPCRLIYILKTCKTIIVSALNIGVLPWTGLTNKL